jgi:hypothetical protein
LLLVTLRVTPRAHPLPIHRLIDPIIRSSGTHAHTHPRTHAPTHTHCTGSRAGVVHLECAPSCQWLRARHERSGHTLYVCVFYGMCQYVPIFHEQPPFSSSFLHPPAAPLAPSCCLSLLLSLSLSSSPRPFLSLRSHHVLCTRSVCLYVSVCVCMCLCVSVCVCMCLCVCRW